MDILLLLIKLWFLYLFKNFLCCFKFVVFCVYIIDFFLELCWRDFVFNVDFSGIWFGFCGVEGVIDVFEVDFWLDVVFMLLVFIFFLFIFLKFVFVVGVFFWFIFLYFDKLEYFFCLVIFLSVFCFELYINVLLRLRVWYVGFVVGRNILFKDLERVYDFVFFCELFFWSLKLFIIILL